MSRWKVWMFSSFANREHGVTDFGTAATVFASPSLFGHAQRAARICVVPLLSALLIWGAASPAKKADTASVIQTLVRNSTTCCSEENFHAFAGQANAVKGIEDMLKEQTDQAHWPKAILALGIVAPYSSETVHRLWSFMRSDGSFAACLGTELPWWHYKSVAPSDGTSVIEDNLARTKFEVPVAVGSLLARSTGQTEGLGELIAGSDPKHWQGQIHWSGVPLFGSDEERNLLLATQCLKGLLLSHQRAAKEFIIGDLRAHPPPTDETFLDSVDTAFSVVSRWK